MFIGIDPGLSGAIAILQPDVGLVVIDMPVVQTGRRAEPDFAQMALFLRPYVGKVTKVLMEKVNAMPKQGVTSTFRFGYVSGGMAAVVLTLGMPVEFIAPTAWKRRMGLGKDKDHSRLLASQLYPHYAGRWSRKKDDGRAEAVLLAHTAANQSSKNAPTAKTPTGRARISELSGDRSPIPV